MSTQKINSIPHFFLTLQTCYIGQFRDVWPQPPKMANKNLWTTLNTAFMQKLNFISHFFPEILHLKSYHLIGQKCFGQYIGNQNFARYGVCGEIPLTIWFSISDYFKEKLMSIFFLNCKKDRFFGPFWAHF